MNIFTIFEADKNPVARLLERLDQLDRKSVPPVPGKVLFFGCRLVAICLPLLLGFAGLLAKFRCRLQSKNDGTVSTLRKQELSIIILNWNGADLLPRCIQHLEAALARVPGDHEILVADNGSTDNSLNMLRQHFPTVKIIPLGKNKGFSRGNNEAVKYADKDLIMLLNNDIFLHEATFETLLAHFDDQNVFAVAPKVVLEDGTLNEGHSWGEFNDSMLLFHNERQDSRLDIIRRPAVTLYPIGACAIMDRRLYLDMGGLDTMLSPFYWEDDDLGYRALKRGYQVIYDPRVSVIHKNAASSVKLPPAYIRCVKEKNMLLFLWKNLTHPPYLRSYLNMLGQRVESIIQQRDYVALAAYLLAFAQSVELLIRRTAEAPYIVRSDKEALALTRRERKLNQPRSLKRHILLVTPFIPFPLNNGGAIRVYSFVKHLADRYDFSLLSFIDGPVQQPPAELTSLFKHIELVERKHSPVGSLHNSELPELYGYYLSVRMEKSLKEMLAKHQLDIVQVEFPWMAYYGSLVNNHHTIFVEHDVGNMLYGKGFTRPGKGLASLLAPLQSINYEQAFMDCYDKVVTVTNKDHQILETLFPESNITTVEHGVDLTSFPAEYNGGDGRTLVYLGHYRHYPNEEAAVRFVEEIFPLIKKSAPETRLYLVGSHPTRRINRYKGREDVIVTGSVPDVKTYLNKGTIFIAPIRLGAGLKGKMLEAMACGLPIVSSTVAAAGLGVVHGRELMIADTDNEFAVQVLELLANKELRHLISKNARKHVEDNFDWKVLAGRMAMVYQEVLNDECSGMDCQKQTGDNGGSEEFALYRVANG